MSEAAAEPVFTGLLVAGGELDAHLDRVLTAATHLGAETLALRVGPESHPRLHWDLDADVLLVDDRPCSPRAVFLRHDVFAWLEDPRETVAERARAWQDTLLGWLRAHPEVRWLNRGAPSSGGQKPADLVLARRCGFSIPRTWLSNDLAEIGLMDARDLVTKPVSGGQHCQHLGPALERAPRRGDALAAPALVQTRVPGADLRLYLVGEARLCFRLEARTLDLREDPAPHIAEEALSSELAAPVERFQAAAALDLAALDFKLGPEGPVFLEANRQPMFAAFDEVAEGRLSEALVRWLLGNEAPGPP